jgi:hypothetical protein
MPDELAGLTERQRRLLSIIDAQAKQLLVQAFAPIRHEVATFTDQIGQMVERELAGLVEHLDMALSCLPPSTRKGR